VGLTLDECEAALNEVLGELTEDGPTEAEDALARRKAIAGVVFATESAEGLGRRLGSLAVVTDWRYHLGYAKALEAATPASVKAVLGDADGEADRAKAAGRAVDEGAVRALFDPRFAVVGRLLPRKGAEAPGGAAGSGGGGGRRSGAAEKGSFGSRRRSEPGASGAAIERALDLKPARAVLENGLTVVALRSTLAPVFTARLQVRDGRLHEAVPGLDAMTTNLLDEGTTTRTAEEVAQAIGSVGGTLDAGAAGVSAKTLSADAPLALALVREVATSPAFPAEAVDRVRAQQLYEIADELDTPRAVAVHMLNEAIYGAGHPLGRSANGTRESVREITREAMAAHHAKVYVPRNAILAIVSDRPPEEAVALARTAFASWTGGPPPALSLPEIPAPRAQTLHKDLDREQTNLYLGQVGIRRSDPDFVALEVMENVFGTGAGFTDRLSKNIRDERGLAYTVSGNLTRNSDVLPGTLRVFANPNPKNAPLALSEMRKEVQGILDRPPTPDELRGAKAALRGGMISRCETASDLATLLLLLERHGLGFDYPRRYLAEVEKVTAEDVVRAARKHVRPDALVEVVVGRMGP
jgi:zinc protease